VWSARLVYGPVARIEVVVVRKSVPTLSDEQVSEMLRLVEGSDGVELKLTVPDSDQRSAVAALDMDVLDAQVRQVAFFDTPELTLNDHGVVVRARRVQGKPGDSIVKLRPIVPDDIPATVRESPSFGIEVDAMPGGFVCSGSMKAKVDPAKAKEAFTGRRPIAKLFTKEQRDFYADHAPDGIALDDLSMLGPISIMKLKFTPGDFGRRLVAELWFYPDGSRILELSTKCGTDEAFEVAAETRSFLEGRGVDLAGEQQTKTKTALDFFAAELSAAARPQEDAMTETVSTGAEPDRRRRVIDELRVMPGTPANLEGRATRWAGGDDFAELSADELDTTAKAVRAEGIEQLKEAQELLWASDTHSLLLVFQAMDAAGKDSTIEHVMSGVNPQGVQVVSFRSPSSEELDHHFLWRISKNAPERGRIGIFNRSQYEEVVALKVHPEWLEKQKLPPGDRGPGFWADRYEDLNAFERHLARNGTKIVKFFLHVSKAEQKRRFMARLDNPDKQWKFKAGDVAVRAHWDAYMQAYEDAITATSTEWAPWFVLPADNKHVMQAMTATIIVDAITSLGLEYPTVSDEDREDNARARKVLEAEAD
jgi:PPK2 family polyphosphate:nucleotide phosphotransferase